jgi:hypothetical protein
MRRLLLLTVFFSVLVGCVQAQDSTRKGIIVGLEQDVLPYATGGYFAGVWAGKGHMRVRTIMARVHKPDLIVKENFTNNKVTAYAILGDYFLKEDWKGWWAGAGLVYWKSSIQPDTRLQTVHYENLLLNGSIGYNWKLYRNFYVGPWAGMHLRIGGDKKVTADGKSFVPPLLNPEASVKVGWHL